MSNPLLSLAPSDLRSMAVSVRAGRLTPPYSAISLQRIVGDCHAAEVAQSLSLLSTRGLSPEALASCLELTADALVSRPQLDDLVDLVTTGPDVGGIANRSTAVVVSELFRNAHESVLIAGYAVYQGQKVFLALAERMAALPTLQVRMFLDVARKQGDTSSAETVTSRFVHQFKSSQWPGEMPLPQVYCCKQLLEDVNGRSASLHAKCTVVDGQRVFVSSANFTEAAQQRNVEIGLLLQSRIVSERVRRFFDTLVDTGYFGRII